MYVRMYVCTDVRVCMYVNRVWQYEIEAKCVSQSKMAAKGWNDVGIRDQYPRDVIKLAGLKNDLNSMR